MLRCFAVVLTWTGYFEWMSRVFLEFRHFLYWEALWMSAFSEQALKMDFCSNKNNRTQNIIASRAFLNIWINVFSLNKEAVRISRSDLTSPVHRVKLNMEKFHTEVLHHQLHHHLDVNCYTTCVWNVLLTYTAACAKRYESPSYRRTRFKPCTQLANGL